jgi:hypothetical protein
LKRSQKVDLILSYFKKSISNLVWRYLKFKFEYHSFNQNPKIFFFFSAQPKINPAQNSLAARLFLFFFLEFFPAGPSCPAVRPSLAHPGSSSSSDRVAAPRLATAPRAAVHRPPAPSWS